MIYIAMDKSSFAIHTFRGPESKTSNAESIQQDRQYLWKKKRNSNFQVICLSLQRERLQKYIVLYCSESRVGMSTTKEIGKDSIAIGIKC